MEGERNSAILEWIAELPNVLRVGFNSTHMSGSLDECGDDVVSRYVDTRQFVDRRNRSKGGVYGSMTSNSSNDSGPVAIAWNGVIMQRGGPGARPTKVSVAQLH